MAPAPEARRIGSAPRVTGSAFATTDRTLARSLAAIGRQAMSELVERIRNNKRACRANQEPSALFGPVGRALIARSPKGAPMSELGERIRNPVRYSAPWAEHSSRAARRVRR